MTMNRERRLRGLFALCGHLARTALFVLGLFSLCPAAAMYCGSSLVSSGATKAEVVMHCGEPTSRESRQEETVEKIDHETKRIVTTIIDEWTYDLGPNSLMRILEFRNGTLADIREGKYGGTRASGCDGRYPDRGSTRAEVSAQCGEPNWKEERQEEIVSKTDTAEKTKMMVMIEEWTYNLGPNRFIRIYEFRNGRLADIRTGGYGR